MKKDSSHECADGEPGSSSLPCEVHVTQTGDGTWEVCVSGSWIRGAERPPAGPVIEALDHAGAGIVHLREGDLREWDDTLLAFLFHIALVCRQRGWAVEEGRLNDGLAALFRLATAVPEAANVQGPLQPRDVLSAVGQGTLATMSELKGTVAFLGETTLAVGRAMVGRARFRRKDLIAMLHMCGPEALGIISLIAFLMGLILAFVGAIQLRLFGAEIYVADLVGIGIVREMGAIMTGVVMAGRSGAAFAAQIGTMQVNEEVDALRTTGVDPVDFLVLPRLLAMTLMMPLLCLYADVMGIVGGMVVGVGMLGVGMRQYWNETCLALALNDVAVGLFMAFVFGVLVSLAGCLRGMQCGRSSSAVGQAATSAVVSGIVWVVVATAVITVTCDIIGV